MNTLVLTAAVAFSLSQILLSLLLLSRSPGGWSVQKWIFTVFLVGVAGYLLTPMGAALGYGGLMSALQTLVPGLFWLFCASLFDDHFRLRWWQLALVAATVILPQLGNLIDNEQSPLRQMLYLVPQTLEFVLMSLALLAVVRTWQTDLVESRRDLRVWFCGLNGAYIMSLLLVREVLFSGAEWLSVWQYVPVGLMVLITNMILLEYKGSLFEVRSKPTPLQLEQQPPTTIAPVEQSQQAKTNSSDAEPAPTLKTEPAVKAGAPLKSEPVAEPVPQELLERLNQLMEEEHFYREMGLTIGQLAAKMELPEYRLRKLINAGLGYRNFNDFLNTYRIREASQRLSDPAEADTPVLNIALDAGYRSLSSFNKAFKDTLAKTPTEFRNSLLND